SDGTRFISGSEYICLSGFPHHPHAPCPGCGCGFAVSRRNLSPAPRLVDGWLGHQGIGFGPAVFFCHEVLPRDHLLCPAFLVTLRREADSSWGGAGVHAKPIPSPSLFRHLLAPALLILLFVCDPLAQKK